MWANNINSVFLSYRENLSPGPGFEPGSPVLSVGALPSF